MIPTAAIAGFFAGFFGIGGGAITVPVLFYIFNKFGIDHNYVMHLAVGTSFSIIIPTAIVSVYTHYKHNAVDFNIVKVCNSLANKGLRVIIAGLDMDYKGNPFGPMPALMATAEYVTKVHAVCTRTGNLANHSFRTSENNSLIHIGEKESYEPLSRSEFQKEFNLRDKKEN